MRSETSMSCGRVIDGRNELPRGWLQRRVERSKRPNGCESWQSGHKNERQGLMREPWQPSVKRKKRVGAFKRHCEKLTR